MIKSYLRAGSLGIEIAAAVFICAFLGYKADEILKSAPWGMVVGVVVGACAGFLNVIRVVGKENARS